MSVFSGLSRPLKAAGVALVAVAVVAAVIGGITVLNSGSSSDTAAPSSSAPVPPPGSPTPPPSGSPTPPPSETPSPSPSPSPSSPVPPSPSPGGQPGQTGQPGQPGGDDQQTVAKWVVVRIYNNSTIKGLAAKAKDDFIADGWKVEEVGNYASGVIPATTAYFRPGTDEETAAKSLAAEFGMRSEARFEGIQNSSPGVIVIVTNNYQPGGGKR